MSEQYCIDVETTQLTSHPFKNMKKVKNHHTGTIYDFSIIKFNEEIKLVTCSNDETLRIFDLEVFRCEKIVKHNRSIFSVYFYEEKEVLLTTDEYGELCLWNLFSFQIIQRTKISISGSFLWKLTKVSENLFCCCVKFGSSIGSLYSIRFNSEKNDLEIKIEEIEFFDFNIKGLKIPKEPINCIYTLKNEKNTIIFSGGFQYSHGNCIKKYDFNSKNKKHFFKFPQKHFRTVTCLTSFFNSNSKEEEEIIISGSEDHRIIFWDSKNGKKLKEIKLCGEINCFLNNFNSENIFVITGYRDYSIYSLDLRNKRIIKNVDRIHDRFIHDANWINKEKQLEFITCSHDYSFNIFQLSKKLQNLEKEDLEERVEYLRDKEFNQIYSSKNFLFSIKFWNNFRIRMIFKALLEYY